MSIFAFAIFAAAFLLFQVQPLIGKFILPWFGGSPSVWSVCLLFFQVLLLAGYAYAHATTRWLPPRLQAGLHLLVLAAAILALPIAPGETWKPAPGDDPTRHILALLLACVGLPYFALAATGPLLQRWLNGLTGGAPPYRLYALSNLGSLLALLTYPFAVEPLLSRSAQAAIWSWALGGCALLCGACALRTWRAAADAEQTWQAEAWTAGATPPTALTWALWLMLPATASVMLLATTNKMTEDVAVIPFLWVLPLSLYLLSFILCFEDPRWYDRSLFGAALLVSLAAPRALPLLGNFSLPTEIALQALPLVVVCMICHGELHRLRPHPRYLTAFYLTLATGGALGGALVVLLAPLVFVHYEEYELALLGTALLALLVHYRDVGSPLYGGRPRRVWACLIAAVVGLGGVLLAGGREGRELLIYAARDFYGPLYIRSREISQVPTYTLEHGDTVHGFQLRAVGMSRWPTTYYGEESGVGLAWRHLPHRGGLRVGAVGLGVGTIATYAADADRLSFYELNPRVLKLARERFTYLAESKAQISVALGDARLTLEREPPQNFDLLVLDAFTSGAIPVHLLTLEAFRAYLRHLRPEGVIAVHVSNRYLNLTRVLKALAAELGLTAARVADETTARRWWLFNSEWVLMTRNQAFLSQPAIAAASQILDGRGAVLWTDDYTSLFRVVRWRRRAERGARETPPDGSASAQGRTRWRGSGITPGATDPAGGPRSAPPASP